MGFPSTGTEALYRNKLKHVARFLQEKHHDKFMVYNLCSEREYNLDKFGGKVVKFPFDDHNAPPLAMVRTIHVARFTLHASRFTLHASRFTLHASRFTLHA
jgi:hypothetical protein